jgi:HSP20 family protein
MSFGNMEPDDWFRRFFGGRGLSGGGRRGGEGWFGDISAGFDEMRRRFEEQFRDIQTKAPKELVREYQTQEGDKVREIGPIVHGYSATIGPDGKPTIREFGNVISSRSRERGFNANTTGPQITAEREPLVDIITSDKEVKVVVELPGVNKENININSYDNSVEISANTSDRKYRRVVDLPPEATGETAKSTYKNGILEIVFNKKEQSTPKGKQINIE